jgi:hypothetical protein
MKMSFLVLVVLPSITVYSSKAEAAVKRRLMVAQNVCISVPVQLSY